MSPSPGEITQLLARWSNGDHRALETLAAVVQSELRRIAGAYLQRQRPGHTLQPTALVNEAWLRLVKQDNMDFESRRRFFALAAQLMRQVLTDYARSARAGKRGGGNFAVSMSDGLCCGETGLEEFLVLNEALEQLGAVSPRQARVIELRYFGGLNVEESAGLLGVSPATISREQHSAEAWLSRAMSAARD